MQPIRSLLFYTMRNPDLPTKTDPTLYLRHFLFFAARTCEHHRRVITTSPASKHHVALVLPSPLQIVLFLEDTHA